MQKCIAKSQILDQMPEPTNFCFGEAMQVSDALAFVHLRNVSAKVSTEVAHYCCLVFSLVLNTLDTVRAGAGRLRWEREFVDTLLPRREGRNVLKNKFKIDLNFFWVFSYLIQNLFHPDCLYPSQNFCIFMFPSG